MNFFTHNRQNLRNKLHLHFNSIFCKIRSIKLCVGIRSYLSPYDTTDVFFAISEIMLFVLFLDLNPLYFYSLCVLPVTRQHLLFTGVTGQFFLISVTLWICPEMKQNKFYNQIFAHTLTIGIRRLLQSNLTNLQIKPCYSDM